MYVDKRTAPRNDLIPNCIQKAGKDRFTFEMKLLVMRDVRYEYRPFFITSECAHKHSAVAGSDSCGAVPSRSNQSLHPVASNYS